jgi:hypothetical protein
MSKTTEDSLRYNGFKKAQKICSELIAAGEGNTLFQQILMPLVMMDH